MAWDCVGERGRKGEDVRFRLGGVWVRQEVSGPKMAGTGDTFGVGLRRVWGQGPVASRG